MVLKVSSLLRAVLQYGTSDLITLDEELKFIEDYLALQKMRLENRLELSWDIHPDTRQVLVPQLIMQPLVENAILHGVACCRVQRMDTDHVASRRRYPANPNSQQFRRERTSRHRTWFAEYESAFETPLRG